jgi:hypothetical protein
MDLRPSFHQPPLRPRQVAPQTLDRLDREHGFLVLIDRVEVRPMVWGADLHEHPDDDSEETRQFRHVVIPVASSSGSSG